MRKAKKEDLRISIRKRRTSAESKIKRLPDFKGLKEEKEFWVTHDSTEYIDYSKGKRVLFSHLKPSTRTISIRLPESLIEHLKVLANKRDVPYQSLLKMFLIEKVEEAFREAR
jgi:predicted DNA binding CopG/RHH family protein